MCGVRMPSKSPDTFDVWGKTACAPELDIPHFPLRISSGEWLLSGWVQSAQTPARDWRQKVRGIGVFRPPTLACFLPNWLGYQPAALSLSYSFCQFWVTCSVPCPLGPRRRPLASGCVPTPCGLPKFNPALLLDSGSSLDSPQFHF